MGQGYFEKVVEMTEEVMTSHRHGGPYNTQTSTLPWFKLFDLVVLQELQARPATVLFASYFEAFRELFVICESLPNPTLREATGGYWWDEQGDKPTGRPSMEQEHLVKVIAATETVMTSQEYGGPYNSETLSRAWFELFDLVLLQKLLGEPGTGLFNHYMEAFRTMFQLFERLPNPALKETARGFWWDKEGDKPEIGQHANSE